MGPGRQKITPERVYAVAGYFARFWRYIFHCVEMARIHVVS